LPLSVLDGNLVWLEALGLGDKQPQLIDQSIFNIAAWHGATTSNHSGGTNRIWSSLSGLHLQRWVNHPWRAKSSAAAFISAFRRLRSSIAAAVRRPCFRAFWLPKGAPRVVFCLIDWGMMAPRGWEHRMFKPLPA